MEKKCKLYVMVNKNEQIENIIIDQTAKNFICYVQQKEHLQHRVTNIVEELLQQSCK